MGSEFNKYGGLTFEGEFFHGIKWKGIGKEYYVYGKLKSEVEYLYGKKVVMEKNIILGVN